MTAPHAHLCVTKEVLAKVRILSIWSYVSPHETHAWIIAPSYVDYQAISRMARVKIVQFHRICQIVIFDICYLRAGVIIY